MLTWACNKTKPKIPCLLCSPSVSHATSRSSPFSLNSLSRASRISNLSWKFKFEKSSIPSPFSNGECCKCACFFFSHLVCDRLPLHYCPQLLLALLYHGGGPRVCAGVGVIPRRDRGLLPAKRFSLNLKEVELCEKWSVFLPASRLLLGLQAAQGDLPLDLERSLEQK